jgi:hypothetical protein
MLNEIKIDDLSAVIGNLVQSAMCCTGPMCDVDCQY